MFWEFEFLIFKLYNSVNVAGAFGYLERAEQYRISEMVQENTKTFKLF